MSEAEIDRQIEDRYRKAEHSDSHDITNTNTASLDLGDQLKTPLVAALIVAIGVLALAVVVEGVYLGGEISTVRANSQDADTLAHQSEREARVLQDKTDDLRIQVKVLEGVMQTVGLPVPKKDK